MNTFKYSDNNKRYHTLSYYNKTHFGRVMKASINSGLTCPNIDGTKGIGGCTYCNGSASYFTNSKITINSQLDAEINRIKIKYPDAKINAYFQANSNTYTDEMTLRNMIETAADNENVVSVTLSTRADCIDENIISILQEYEKCTNICVELGLQSIHESTAKIINRCHSFDDFLHGYTILKNAGIRTCVHIINSLPHESKEMMLQTAKVLGELYPDAVKIHMLHIISGTKMADQYNQGCFFSADAR